MIRAVLDANVLVSAVLSPHLECAVEGRADFLASGDAHLLGLGAYRGIPIVKPAVVLESLEGEYVS
jgi:predicted nucleic acid-binding protein